MAQGIFEEFPRLLAAMEYMDEVPPNSPDFEVPYAFPSCWTVMNPGAHFDREDVAAAIIVSQGNLSDAAKLLKRARRSLENFICRDAALVDLRTDLWEASIDHIEKLYIHKALGGDAQALRFFLTTKGKERGYVTRNEATGKDGAALIETPIMSEEQLKNLSEDEINQLMGLVDKAQGSEVEPE